MCQSFMLLKLEGIGFTIINCQDHNNGFEGEIFDLTGEDGSKPDLQRLNAAVRWESRGYKSLS
jgi:hypothetical protein